jgi:hypothetical protein
MTRHEVSIFEEYNISLSKKNCKVHLTSIPTENEDDNKKPHDGIDVAWIIGWGGVDDIGGHFVWVKMDRSSAYNILYKLEIKLQEQSAVSLITRKERITLNITRGHSIYTVHVPLPVGPPLVTNSHFLFSQSDRQKGGQKGWGGDTGGAIPRGRYRAGGKKRRAEGNAM